VNKKEKKVTVFPAPSCPPVGEEEEKEQWPEMFPKECQECRETSSNREILEYLLMFSGVYLK
jgi:hypothetical protein